MSRSNGDADSRIYEVPAILRFVISPDIDGDQVLDLLLQANKDNKAVSSLDLDVELEVKVQHPPVFMGLCGNRNNG